MLVLLALFLAPAGAFADGDLPVHRPVGLDEVDVCIFQVLDGVLSPTVIGAAELFQQPVLDLPGHVAGLLVLSPEALTLHLDGEPVHSVRPDPSGAFHLNHGKLPPRELEAAFVGTGRGDFDIRRLQGYKGCYAAFAPVPGDALCPGSRFTLDLEAAGEHFSVQIDQIERRDLEAIDPELALGEALRFSYLGNDTQRLLSRTESARTRLAAVTAGIRHIEAIIGAPLVTVVHLVDFTGRSSALTRSGFSEIWLYSPTFWNETPAGLRTMVEHETLHLLADRCAFARNGALRELFADLRGLKSLSRERFSLITMGILPATVSRSTAADNTLLAFINEMNFFKGMRGGHSRDNLDEFFASFLHTLVFVQDLERAVHAPVLFPDRFTRHLGDAERKTLMDDYVRVIYALKAGLENQPNVDRFLRECLEHAARLQQRLP